jgi:hypothetical protein
VRNGLVLEEHKTAGDLVLGRPKFPGGGSLIWNLMKMSSDTMDPADGFPEDPSMPCARESADSVAS